MCIWDMEKQNKTKLIDTNRLLVVRGMGWEIS